MSPTEITSKDLHRIVELLAERQTLAGRLAEVDRQLAGYDGDARQPVVHRGRQACAPRNGQRRQLKDTILEFVHQAGAKGATLQAIADQAGVPPHRIHTWFQKNGKRLECLKKVAPATYRWRN